MRATRWSRTTAGFAADLTLYVVIALALWLVIPMLILGWTPVVITSGSMSPAIEPGDVLLVERGVPEAQLFVPGTILTYEASAPAVTVGGNHSVDGDELLTRRVDTRPRLVTHRVDRIDADGHYVTRGDANGASDPQPVAPEQVLGAARLLVPNIGLPVHWARDGRLLQLGLVVFALMATIFASRLDEAHQRPAAQDGRGDRDDEAAASEPRSRSTGLPAAGAILGIVALSFGSLVPTAEAAFSESSANGGNRFSTAAAQDVATAALELPLHDGASIVDGDVGSGTTLNFQVTTDEEHYLAGEAHARLRVRRRGNFAGNSSGEVELTLSTGGTVLANGASDGITDSAWHTVTFPLSPAVFDTFDAGTTFEIEVTLNRIEMEVGGPSAIVMAGN